MVPQVHNKNDWDQTGACRDRGFNIRNVLGINTVMKSWVKCLSFIVAAAALGSTCTFALASAQTPCVNEICIGDGLDRLRTVAWVPVQDTSERIKTMRQSDRARRAKTFRDDGFDDNGTPAYLILREFDGDLIDDMARIDVACESNQLTGTFVSKGGNMTKVHVSLLPSEEEAPMSWQVTGISRLYKNTRDRSQRVELERVLQNRYGDYKGYGRADGISFLFVPGADSSMVLSQVLPKFKNSHALCEEASVVNVD